MSKKTRRHQTAEEFRDAVRDVYDGYGSAELAVLLPAPSDSFQLQSSPPGGPHVVAAWPTESEYESGFVPLEAFRAALRTEDAAARSEVSMLRLTANEGVKQIAEQLGYLPTIRGQLSGYWLGPGEAPPTACPPYQPTGAVLPRNGSQLDECLALVLLDHEWRVLSTAAVETYRHTLGMQAGELWRFAVFDRGESPARVYRSELLEPIAPMKVLQRFGQVVSERARKDRPAVVLRLTEHAGG